MIHFRNQWPDFILHHCSQHGVPITLEQSQIPIDAKIILNYAEHFISVILFRVSDF